MRRSLWLLLLLTCVAGGALAASSSACACGMALQADVVRERALVIQHGGQGHNASEEIVASFDLTVDDGGRAAVILPVPGDPTVKAVEGDPLGYLDLATTPPAEQTDSDGAGAVGGAAPGGGVDVIGRETVGGYDVSRLRANDPKALGRWLDEHGYTQPAGAQPILAQYVRRGWRYVAIRLAKGQEGALKPLRIAFPTPSLVYPMRLSRLATKPVSVTLYVLADREQQVPILSTTFAEPLARLRPRPPANLRSLFPPGAFVTKFVADQLAPSEFTRDLVITLAAGGAASNAGDLGALGGGDGVAWWIVVLAAVVLVGGAVAIGRRPPA
jgi:hypothetical protein